MTALYSSEAVRLNDGEQLGWPEPRAGEVKVVLSHEELAMLLGGIDLSQARHRPWYRSKIDINEVGPDRINTARNDCFPQLTSVTK